MTNESWQTILQGLGLLGAAGAGARYLWDRNEERSWKKTQFLMELAKDFDSEERTKTAFRVFDGPHEKLHHLLKTPKRQLKSKDVDLVHCIDRYFDFFDRLYVFVYTIETLSLQEAMVFGGFLDIMEDEQVRAYARSRGFGDVVTLADNMANLSYEREQSSNQVGKAAASRRIADTPS